jgi:hypothetical protein
MRNICLRHARARRRCEWCLRFIDEDKRAGGVHRKGAGGNTMDSEMTNAGAA